MRNSNTQSVTNGYSDCDFYTDGYSDCDCYSDFNADVYSTAYSNSTTQPGTKSSSYSATATVAWCTQNSVGN